MSRRRHTLFAAPLVVTVAIAPACDKSKDTAPPREPDVISRNPPEPPPDRPPPLVVDAGAGGAAVDAAPFDPGKITFNGHVCLQGPPGQESSVPCPPELLPEARPGEAVIAFGRECRIAGHRQVRCPDGGPTIVEPRPNDTVSGRVHTQFDPGQMACTEWEDMTCPPDATCNPPPPRQVPCPDDLLPSLAPGVAPTSRKGGECFLGEVEVACPTAEVTGPAVTQVPDGDHARLVRRDDGSCWRQFDDDCDPGVKCNPPEPEPAPCPDALLPAVVNGKSPKRKKDGTCWWGNTQVRCK